MRVWKSYPAVLLVALLAVLSLAVVAGCGETEEAGAGKTEAEPPAKDVQAEENIDTEEGNDSVTATLTKIVGDRRKGGTKKEVEVPYLPPGRKIATLETTKGEIKIELWEDEAPNTVVNFTYLANTGRYDGVPFHRVIEGFMAQTGDVEKGDGSGSPGWSIPAEFDPALKHERGVVSMARLSGLPDSAGSQFFIMYVSHQGLDGDYAAFGKVVEGMDVVDSLNTGEPPQNPDKILKARVEFVPEK